MSVAQLAKEIGISKSSLYNHLKDTLNLQQSESNGRYIFNEETIAEIKEQLSFLSKPKTKETPKIKTLAIQNRRYLGNKFKLLPFFVRVFIFLFLSWFLLMPLSIFLIIKFSLATIFLLYSSSDFLENLPNIIPTVIQERIWVLSNKKPVFVSPKKAYSYATYNKKRTRIISKGEHSFSFIFCYRPIFSKIRNNFCTNRITAN